MTLVQLRHLIALAESGSFTQSAEALCITQPALSRSVQALERELGQPLFDRTGRRSELTAFGREVVQRARQLVFEADELVASGRQMSAGQAGAVRLGLGSGPSAILSTPLLRTVATRHPGLRLDIVRGPIEHLLQALRERQLDALVIDARSLPPAADLRVTAVTELRGAFLCRPDHPLTRWKRALRFAALQQYPIASTPLSDEVARVLVERYGRAAHPASCVTLRCEDIPALVEVARDSDTVLLAIRAAAPDFVELPLQPALDFTARFAVVTLAGRTEAPAMPLVRKLVQEYLHD
ncbi:LysR family transcriptional regulator [Azohydromonas caseinilytica]|uniref:LysR family transcriptional regulator n=1 Tax=Azohydromonas caseinilytica TaxID=2728836 RepID=A0A848FK19_9BURK|nr:LysR family transcriptional regulator [Azohydromonas caseinilytica]NML18141.1 LysR family transcriptional regulator [Azohydromonas caseinilytica]